ncbi:MAG: site-specific DNA-methyltransferase [Pseudomonadota bacterium]|nr:site-specific DNA-methyltransferase [Pseudomonadota bacterium]
MSKIIRPIDSNSVLHGNCVEIMNNMTAGSIDMVFADPPYNLQLRETLYRPNNTRVAGVEEAWDKFDDLKTYDRFTHDWLKAVRHVLKDDGTLWVIGSYHNIFRVGTILQDLGFWILNDIIWRKSNPMPNFRGTRFTNAHETLLWAAKSPDSKYTFNYDCMKQLNDGLQMRSDWILPVCSGGERLKDEEGIKAHSAQKPLALLYRVLMASSKAGETVLDPFFGTGTTGAAAKRLGRNCIGIDREAKYVRLARERIANVEAPVHHGLVDARTKRQEPRIPFGWVLERGLLIPGDILFDTKRKFEAEVHADGTIFAQTANGNVRGSIHKVGAAVQGSQACNGWLFWHFDAPGKLQPIDLLRRQLRAEGFGAAA